MIDTRQFNSMCRELSKRAKIPPDEAVVHEIGKVLEATIRFTGTATVGSIRRTSENALVSMQPQTMYTPARGRKGVGVTTGGFITYYLDNRYPDALWNRMLARRKADLVARLRARGLSRQSWLRLARQLHLMIKHPSYIARAVPKTGREHPENTTTRIARQSGRLQVVISNSQPTVNRIGGDRALQRAIDGREKYFVRSVGRKVFDDAKKIAKRYPGIKITG